MIRVNFRLKFAFIKFHITATMSKREQADDTDTGQPHCKSARTSMSGDMADNPQTSEDGDSEPILLPSSGVLLSGADSEASDIGFEDFLASDPFNLENVLKCIEDYDEAADTILNNTELKSAIMKKIGKSVTESFRSSLKNSKLTADKKQRNYLLGINPRELCLEFKTLFPEAYSLLVEVILGMPSDTVFESTKLINTVCLLY